MLRLDSFDSEAAEIHLHHDPRFVTQYTSPVNSRTAQTPYAAAETPSSQHRSKKRKIDRACDFCRRRKTKCDGPVMPGNICTNCIQTGRACSYVETSKPRGPPKAYVVALEDRVERMEALLKRLRPEADFATELGPPIVRDSWKSDFADTANEAPSSTSRVDGYGASSSTHNLLPLAAAIPRPGSPSAEPNTQAPGFQRSSPPYPGARRSRKPRSRKECPLLDPQMAYVTDDPSSTSSLSSEDEESAVELSLVQGITQLTLHGLRPAHVDEKQVVDGQWRFHGKSSSFKLISTARELKQRHMDEVTGSSLPASPARSSPEQVRPGSRAEFFAPRRAQYWGSLPWEISFEGADHSVTPPFLMSKFPPLDLAEDLVELYFSRNNSLFPLLHRPTFQKQWSEGLYKTDLWFAGVCMAIFAVASRWSDDPRVLPEGTTLTTSDGSDNGAWALAGWKYVDAALDVHRHRRSLFLPANIFEIQTFVLMGMYFRGTIGHAESWTIISIGIIKAQDVGAHRKKVYGRQPTVEEELWKRAIWHLIAMDRLGSVLIGRPCCSRDEDFDLDLPMEVDDEYWENDNPELAFQQPAETPALITAFVYWVRLSQISAFVLRTLYAIGRFKQPLGLVGPRWREQVIERLNSALLQWIESLPPHLRWSPDMEDDVFASQSAMLYLTYYIVQITIYKPFLSLPRPHVSGEHAPQEGSEGPLAALAICTSAARAGTRILEVLLLRGLPRHTVVVHFTFVFAGVLLVNLWAQIAKDAEQRGLGSINETNGSARLEEQSKDLFSLLSMLSNMRPRWELAREAFDDILLALPPSLLRVALARFEPSSEESREAEDAAVVYDGDSSTDHPPYRFFYPSSGPSSYVYPGESQASDGTSSFAPHGDDAYLANTQQAHQRTAPAHHNGAWSMPVYDMSAAYGDTDAALPAAAGTDHRQRIPVSHDRRPYGEHGLTMHNGSYHRPMEHDMNMSSSVRGADAPPSRQLPHILGGAEAGYGELPYVKIEHNDDITPSQVLWPDSGHYSAPHAIRRYPGSLEGYQPQPQVPLGDDTTHWRRWGGRDSHWQS